MHERATNPVTSGALRIHLSKADFLARATLGKENYGLTKKNNVFHVPPRQLESELTYFPLIFHPGSASSNCSATSSPSSPNPTTTSLLIVLKLATLGAPAELAMGPMATSNGVLAGAAQSYVNLRWLRSPLKKTRSERDRWRKRSGASE